MRKSLSLAEFRERVSPAAGDVEKGALTGSAAVEGMAVRLAVAGDVTIAAEDRTLSFVFSDASVDRYGDTIEARGWVLDNFKANPIALFGHDASSIANVVGGAKNVRVEGTKLVGDITFATADENPSAETVYRMCKAGFLRTVSVGFAPIEWVATKDKSRPGGIDFKKQELLEISIVPIPANPNALQQARAAGINVDRIALLEAAQPDIEIRAGRAVGRVVTKDLYDVGTMADVVSYLAYIASSSAWEAEYEGDGSDVPARLAELLKTAGQILVDMTAEEVAELIARVTGEDEAKAAGAAFARGVSRTVRAPALASGETLVAVPDAAVESFGFVAKMLRDGRTVVFIDKGVETPVVRAGKVLSADNESALRTAHGQITEACDSILALCDKAAPVAADPNTMPTDAEAKAARARKAAALKLRSEQGA